MNIPFKQSKKNCFSTHILVKIYKKLKQYEISREKTRKRDVVYLTPLTEGITGLPLWRLTEVKNEFDDVIDDNGESGESATNCIEI